MKYSMQIIASWAVGILALPGAFAQSTGGPTLCVEIQAGAYPDSTCYDEGEVVDARIALGASTEPVAGGRIVLQYDPACLDLVHVGACPGSPYAHVLTAAVNESLGTIVYAVSSASRSDRVESSNGSIRLPQAQLTGPADLGCLTFVKTADCTSCAVCLVEDNPQDTYLWNAIGTLITPDACGCSAPLRRNGDLSLTSPSGGTYTADCDTLARLVTWSAPVAANDSCDTDPSMVCTAVHDGGQAIPASTITNGGLLPVGTTSFACTAWNDCGDTVTGEWVVEVENEVALDVVVELSPEMIADTFNRCINFNLFTDCGTMPETVCETVHFGEPPAPDHLGRATLTVPAANYSCIAAQDILHTLAACDVPVCNPAQWDSDNEREGTGKLSVSYVGDPGQGGNWLTGGNLDAWKPGISFSSANTINILDYVTLMSEIGNGASYPPHGDTECDSSSCTLPGPHGDINADGMVDSLDFSFVVDNFLMQSPPCCCTPPAATAPGARTSITVKELGEMGLGQAAVYADIDRNAVVDMEDIALYMQGTEPDGGSAGSSQGN
ncbi:MAG: hypothetical protein J5J06_10570 [Phycisphaerae bacterium]|nr:hypothetical protein [Phycisphaerae bacterium]